MTKQERLLMLKSAMKTLGESQQLNTNAKDRGLKSLQQAYDRYRKSSKA